VLCGFLVTAYLTLICCIAKAILDHLKAEGISTPYFDRWAFALGNSIVSFSDQQVITGISIIIGGLSQLGGGLPVYHWQSVVNLAWFSTMTHLITLTVLRADVRSNGAIRSLRIISMGALIVMLIYTIVPIGYITNDKWVLQPRNSFPVCCLYKPSLLWVDTLTSKQIYPSYNWLYVSIAISILFFSFLTRVQALWTDSSLLRTLLRIPKDEPWKSMAKALHKLEGRNPRNGIWPLVGYKFLYSIYAILSAGSDLYQSKFWEVRFLD
jgi:hypothetical protein